MSTIVASAGHTLRELRESRGLSLRDVERASSIVAEYFGNPDFVLVLSRISDIESKNVTPSLNKLCSLSLIYQIPLQRLVAFYGIDLVKASSELVGRLPAIKTQCFEPPLPESVDLPQFDPSFTFAKTSYLVRFIQKWGPVPMLSLKRLATNGFLYAHIGTTDLTMHPLLRPGTFVQVDQRRRRVVNRTWKHDYDRPIYLVETREGYFCCWCSLPRPGQLIMQPHVHSPVQPRVLRHPEDVEVVGQVVGIAMRLDDDEQ
jgi:transcriptional regulator with XRE-family HTH domain